MRYNFCTNNTAAYKNTEHVKQTNILSIQKEVTFYPSAYCDAYTLATCKQVQNQMIHGQTNLQPVNSQTGKLTERIQYQWSFRKQEQLKRCEPSGNWCRVQALGAPAEVREYHPGKILRLYRCICKIPQSSAFLAENSSVFYTLTMGTAFPLEMTHGQYCKFKSHWERSF